ncbi:MAG: ABC transporter ATP-binding protein [Planctomycetia bacterium]|nr:ABC transporter ATP-binding protein [Planctomycetia bacterium]
MTASPQPAVPHASVELVYENVTKLYGAVIGVNDISLRIRPGITGLLGSNGAGKSTLIKLASGRLRPTQGRVSLGGFDARSTRAKRLLGYCPDVNDFYEEMTGREFVRTMTRLYGYSLSETKHRTEQALERVGMCDRAERRIGGCSHGMRQRIKLAQSIAHDPRVLLLDEPLTGIDPGGRREINELLRQLAVEGLTILVSSHLLGEVEQLCDRLVVVAQGRLIAEGSLAELRRLLEDEPLTIRLESPQARRLAALVVALPDTSHVEVREEAITLRTANPSRFFAQLTELVALHELDVDRLETLDAGAEAVFGYLQRSTS